MWYNRVDWLRCPNGHLDCFSLIIHKNTSSRLFESLNLFWLAWVIDSAVSSLHTLYYIFEAVGIIFSMLEITQKSATGAYVRSRRGRIRTPILEPTPAPCVVPRSVATTGLKSRFWNGPPTVFEILECETNHLYLTRRQFLM